MEVRRLFEFIEYQKENYPLEKAFGYKKNGQWVYFSTDQMIAYAGKIGRGLLKLGLQPGDKVALVSYQNRPEWTMMDLGMLQAGIINVPVYPTISPREYQYIFNDAQVKYCFTGDGDLYDKIKATQANTPSLLDIFTFDKVEGRRFWEEIFTDDGTEAFTQIRDNIQPSDLATIIYTSGTTGNPKGVALSHNNIVSNIKTIGALIPLEPGYRSLSFLPLCHIFERACSFAYMYLGASVTFVGTDNLGGETGDLQAIKPHFFSAVPRLLEKVYEKIYNKGLALTGIKKGLFFWALNLTEDFDHEKTYSGLSALKWRIADKLIFSKWREALGGNVKGIVTGAAACPMKIVRVFSAAGIPIREGYGLTETSPGIAIGRFDKGGARLGSIGPVIADCEVYIDQSDGNYKEGEGEILADGPNIMQGYYNKPEETAAVFKMIDGRRWFCTGDIGKLIPGPGGVPFLKITDRKKELLRTSNGKYVAPAPIESKLKEHIMIENAMVVGENHKFVSALIIPSVDGVKDWCEKHEIPWEGLAEAIRNPKVVDRFQRIIDKCNPDFSHTEQIKKFVLLEQTWEATRTDGTEAELTPTLKLKRRVIMEKCKGAIEGMYKG